MILIDTSAWVEFLRRNGQPTIKERVSMLLELDEAAIAGPIRFELLSGADKKSVNDLRSIFSLCEYVPFTEATWDEAAEVEKSLRKKGVTIPRDDIFIAAVALHNDLPLFHRDKHFELIVRSGFSLRLV